MNAMYISKEIPLKKITRLYKKMIKHNRRIEMLVIGKKLKNNNSFMNNIKLLDIPIVDGRWLFKFLGVQVIEYISECQNKKISDYNIAIMSDEYNELISYYIKNLIERVKELRIITKKRKNFEKIEREIFENTGSVLIISNCRRKGLNNIDIALNFDFDDEKINMFDLNYKMIIISFKQKIDIKSKLFEGVNANFYDIYLKNRIKKIYEWLNDFENTDIYESYLYQNTKIENIMNKIINDNIKIKCLIGNNGKISEREYINLLDKRQNLS